MAQTFKKIASNGAISQQYARVDNTSILLTVTHKPVTVRSANAQTRIIKTTIDVRSEVPGKACGVTECPPTYPALMQVVVSAPEGALPADFKAALDSAYSAFSGSLNSVFFPQVETIAVP